MQFPRHPGWLLTAAVLLLLCGCTPPVISDTADPDATSIADIVAAAQSSVSPATASASCVQTGDPAGLTERAMLDALNLYRIENGLSPLIYSKKLEAAARTHLQDIYSRGYFDHVTPEGDDPGDRALAAGFCHRYVGENLAAGQPTVAAVMEAWKKSASHNQNMLVEDYVYVGMGFYQAPTGRMFWAQEFALDVP